LNRFLRNGSSHFVHRQCRDFITALSREFEALMEAETEVAATVNKEDLDSTFSRIKVDLRRAAVIMSSTAPIASRAEATKATDIVMNALQAFGEELYPSRLRRASIQAPRPWWNNMDRVNCNVSHAWTRSTVMG
jgi:hypothetical protein